jgi:integrase
VASEAEIIALLEAADALGLPSIGDAIIIALYTCQREGDVLRLTERNGGAGGNRSLAAKVADGEPILFRPHKTRKKNNTAVKAWPDAEGVLARRLGEAEARRRAWSPPRSHKGMRSDYIRSLMSPPSPIMAMGAIVMRERTGLAWNAKSFGKEFSRVRAEAAKACPSLLGADGELALHFQDLRDTGLTRLARGGANPLEIADLSGHAPATVTIILKHYVEMDGELGRQAVQKRDAYLKRAGISF